MKTVKLILIFVVAFTLNMQAQDAPSKKEKIRNEISDGSAKKLEEAENLLQQADAMTAKANAAEKRILKSPMKKKKQEKALVVSKGMRLDAAYLYKKAYDKMYSAYKDEINSCAYESEDRTQADNLAKEAQNNMKNAEKSYKQFIELRKDAGNYKNWKLKKYSNNNLKNTIRSSNELRMAGIAKQEEALCLCYKCNEDALKAQDEEAWAMAQSANTIIAYQTYLNNFPEGIYTSPAIRKIKQLEKEAEEATATNNNNGNNPRLAGVIFRVQILAVSQPATEGELAELYKGGEQIYEEFDQTDRLYKYAVGEYKNYEEAKSYNQANGIADSFIIAIKNGQKVPITDIIPEEDK